MKHGNKSMDKLDNNSEDGVEAVETTTIVPVPPQSLIGVKFTLQPFKEEYINQRYIDWLNDPTINRFLRVRFTKQTYETCLAYVKSYYQGGSEIHEVDKYMWGIFPNGSEEMIGTSTMYDVRRYEGKADFGLLIGDAEYWGKGASTEALELMLRFAFDILGLRRVQGDSNALNSGMNFIFKRLGFSLEGKQREACFVNPGVYVDEYNWGILANEWRAGRKEAFPYGK